MRLRRPQVRAQDTEAGEGEGEAAAADAAAGEDEACQAGASAKQHVDRCYGLGALRVMVCQCACLSGK